MDVALPESEASQVRTEVDQSTADSVTKSSHPAPGPTKLPYPPPASSPTQEGPRGIRFDFNNGARLLLPTRSEGAWRVTLRDLDTGNILFQSENQGAFVSSSKRYFIRFGLEVWDVDAAGQASLCLSHDYDARQRDVLIQLPVGTLGDTLGWFPYVARFAETHNANVICAMSGLIIPLLRDAYPHITFLTHEEVSAQEVAERVYATCSIGLFFDDKENIRQPTDFRLTGLHRTAAYILVL